jgi:hypothetical protein
MILQLKKGPFVLSSMMICTHPVTSSKSKINMCGFSEMKSPLDLHSNIIFMVKPSSTSMFHHFSRWNHHLSPFFMRKSPFPFPFPVHLSESALAETPRHQGLVSPGSCHLWWQGKSHVGRLLGAVTAASHSSLLVRQASIPAMFQPDPFVVGTRAA